MISSNLDFQGLKPIGSNVAEILKPVFKERKNDFLVLDSLNKNWQKIVGDKCWKFCFPKQIKFEKNKKNDALLTISAGNSAIAFYLESNLNQIIQSIAALWGYKIVGAIRIVQEPQIIEAEKKEVKIDSETENFIKKSTVKIKDEELKLTLENLGKSIFGKQS